MYFVELKTLCDEYNLKLVNKNIDISKKIISNPEINRPALQLAGFFDYFSSERIQILGLVEFSYIKTLSNLEKDKIFSKICSYDLPCIIMCRDLDLPDELIFNASKNNIPIFKTNIPTSDFYSDLNRWLRFKLAPRTTMHGVLVDIYGAGVLIVGESGIGKSETALELIKRGHRLVADDAVEIKKVSHTTLIGSSPSLIQHFIEVRGIGIINVQQMFGAQSVKLSQEIDFIIKLELWKDDKNYDRLGLSDDFVEIMENSLICQTLPIRPGRNIAMLCETAAVNYRQKKMGYNAAEVLNERIIKNNQS